MQISTSGPGVGPDPSALLRSSQASAGPRSTMRSKPLVSMRNTRSPHPTTHLALIQDGACRQPLSPSKNLVQKPPPQAQEQGYGATIRNSSGAHSSPRKSVLFPLIPPFLPSDESTVLYSGQTQPAHCPLAHLWGPQGAPPSRQPECRKVTDTGTARRTGRGWRSDVAPENHVLPPLCEVSILACGQCMCPSRRAAWGPVVRGSREGGSCFPSTPWAEEEPGEG